MTEGRHLTTESPFDDPSFANRLQKLLPMLGSEQPAEADAARRKLVEHLATQRLSLTDLAQRLREAPRPPAAGFELSLERQIQIARVARQEAEFETKRARQRVAELSRAVQEAGFDVVRAQRNLARARLLAGAGWVLALVAAAGLLVPGWRDRTQRADQTAAQQGVVLLHPKDPDPTGATLRVGTVLVQDLPVRLTPTADGEVRAFLNRGTRVVLERQVRSGMETWLLIRSVTGSGWVRGSDVLH